MRITISRKPTRFGRLRQRQLPLKPFGVMPESPRKLSLQEPQPQEAERAKAEALA
jgi:hypothetical protein